MYQLIFIIKYCTNSISINKIQFIVKTKDLNLTNNYGLKTRVFPQLNYLATSNDITEGDSKENDGKLHSMYLGYF